MYKIIGADQKEYGPVSAEQMRLWFAERRINGQTSVWSEAAGAWKPLANYPEFADLVASIPVPPVAGVERAVVPIDAVLERDYALDIGDCISRSWSLIKRHFGPIVGVTFLVLFIMGVVNQLLGLVTRPAINQMIYEHEVTVRGLATLFIVSFLTTPIYVVLVAGVFKYYLKLIRGESAGIGDAFAGFSSAFGHLVMLGLVTGFLALIGYCLCILPGIYLTVSWMFATPLVIDRGMGFWDAMECSRKVVAKHWFLIFALHLLCSLIAGCGIIACCIGVLVTVPIGWVALMYAYEDIYGHQAT